MTITSAQITAELQAVVDAHGAGAKWKPGTQVDAPALTAELQEILNRHGVGTNWRRQSNDNHIQ